MEVAGKSKRRGKKGEKPTVFLAKGIVIRPGSACQEEKRGYTLFIKGLLVYLIVMGAMGCFLSSFEIEYSAVVLNIVLLLSALFCSTLYYNKNWEKIGYFILLAVMIWLGSAFSNYINSGFYAIANDISEKAAVFFDTSAMRSYGEQVGNRYVAVTVSMCYIGGVCCVLANILISRHMRYKMAALISIAALLVPFYLEQEPDGVYVAMLIGGLLSVYIIHAGGHYQLTQNNDAYGFRIKERKITYVYAVRTAAAAVLSVLLISSILIALLSLVYPKEQFKTAHTMSPIKKSTMDTVENISILGMMGLFNFYPNTGGLTSGTLGGVSSVRLDLETDLTIEFAPYSDERLYLKTFVGATYFPYSNKWSRLTDINGQIVPESDETASQLKRRYEEGGEHSAKGLMRITNVAAPVGVYLPYYSEDTDKQIYPGRTQEYTYYPRVYNEGLESMDSTDSVEMEQWLYVPKENLEVIAAFVEDAELSGGNVSDVTAKLAAYYQENIPYTLKPGLTPHRKDFVNYFLAENKRGYCAHFASAAVLVFRYLGIPARYVEGYAVDPSDIAGRGTLMPDESYEEYYDGYSPLMTTAVVSVDATDANAHAWVEVYDDELGWVVAEVTPASYEEEPGESLWQRLMDFLTGGQDSESDEEESGDGENGTTLDEQTRQLYVRVLLALAVLPIVIVIGRVLVKRIMQLLNYRGSDRSGKLIIRYQGYIRRVAKKDNELTEMVNYEEQIAWLVYKGYWKADRSEAAACVEILEKAGFSGVEISEEEFVRVMRHI